MWSKIGTIVTLVVCLVVLVGALAAKQAGWVMRSGQLYQPISSREEVVALQGEQHVHLQLYQEVFGNQATQFTDLWVTMPDGSQWFYPAVPGQVSEVTAAERCCIILFRSTLSEPEQQWFFDVEERAFGLMWSMEFEIIIPPPPGEPQV